MDFLVDFSTPLGEIKPVNGVCNGPSKFTAKYFKKAHIPFARLHDMRTHFYHCCDIPSIFRDFDADENDPANYDFTLSDYYIEKIRECGTDIIYRLGSSMEQGDFRFHNQPPKDYAKWARICEHVIRHYNEGWANGHHWNIKYFEIWNEPDTCNPNREMDGQWTGTPEEFGEFLSVAATHLKKCFPDRYIGSYPSCNILTPEREAFFRTVFPFCKKITYISTFVRGIAMEMTRTAQNDILQNFVHFLMNTAITIPFSFARSGITFGFVPVFGRNLNLTVGNISLKKCSKPQAPRLVHPLASLR